MNHVLRSKPSNICSSCVVTSTSPLSDMTLRVVFKADIELGLLQIVCARMSSTADLTKQAAMGAFDNISSVVRATRRSC